MRAMYGLLCLCFATGLALGMSANTARAEDRFGLIMPDSSVVVQPEKEDLTLTLSLVNPYQGRGIPLEPLQAFSALRYKGDTVDRSEHLSVLEETKAYGATGWTTRIALPHDGVYHFIMQTKATWLPELEAFVQHVAKVQVPVRATPEDVQDGWDKPAGLSFEIVPQTRPFGLCAGMLFSGQVLLDGKPVPGALLEATRLNAELKEGKRQAATPYHAVQVVKANDQGVFSFVCPSPGWWAFATSVSGDPLQSPDGNGLKPLEVKTVFWVYMDTCKDRIVKTK